MPIGLTAGIQIPGGLQLQAGTLPAGLPLGIPQGIPVAGLSAQIPAPPPPVDSDAHHQALYARHAVEYEESKRMTVAPEISELCEHHGCDERAAKALHDEMLKRK